MRNGIKEKDIRDFEKYAEKLDLIIRRIRDYNPNAYIYATPNQLNLMGDADDDNSKATDVIVSPLDCGDW